ncbi:PspC domain-containing protein [Evansella sp. AB-P1]|uniref:PspC domain-containing protein n=1 Tax=Evansella sp. AB-P1 TaxID=3037653 RepID=UPI00241BE705|nr:PspC domain-containing protein [Evansella sp. AB-P1]MDG5789249.1 PspC domain-containing protein [Evansella sp. AB-P1]
MKLEKSATDKSLFGVCGGIAEFFGISSLSVRLIFLLTPGLFIPYFILASTLPAKPTPPKSLY